MTIVAIQCDMFETLTTYVSAPEHVDVMAERAKWLQSSCGYITLYDWLIKAGCSDPSPSELLLIWEDDREPRRGPGGKCVRNKVTWCNLCEREEQKKSKAVAQYWDGMGEQWDICQECLEQVQRTSLDYEIFTSKEACGSR